MKDSKIYRVAGCTVETDGEQAQIHEESGFIQTDSDRETVRKVAKKRYENGVSNDMPRSDGGTKVETSIADLRNEEIQIKALEQEVQLERVMDNDNRLYCSFPRIRCPECRNSGITRTTGFGGRMADQNPNEHIKFRCPDCRYRGSKAWDRETENYIDPEEYCQILREEI